MGLCREVTASEMASRICQFIPELNKKEVRCYLEGIGGQVYFTSSIHEWVSFFDGLVIDGKEGFHAHDGT